jgi:hypothetical protein
MKILMKDNFIKIKKFKIKTTYLNIILIKYQQNLIKIN